LWRLPETRLVPTVAWQIGSQRSYAVDGGVYNAGSAVTGIAPWAGTGSAALDAFDRPPAIERSLAFVPALSGLACPIGSQRRWAFGSVWGWTMLAIYCKHCWRGSHCARRGHRSHECRHADRIAGSRSMADWSERLFPAIPGLLSGRSLVVRNLES